MQYELPTKLEGGRYYVPAKITQEGERLRLKFGFNRALIPEIKAMAGARWDPESKTWTIADSPRNRFQLAFLAGWNPYEPFDRDLVTVEHKRFNADGTPILMKHQVDLVRQGLTRHWALWAAEMGTGKTLAAIEVMERSGFDDWLWVGPKSALASVSLEMRKWNVKRRPTFLTYDGMRRLVETWSDGMPAPHGVIFDESSRLKTPTAQRSLSALHLANSIRAEHGDDSFVILMSGSPAPKSPADWWMQCEIACPGYIREGTWEKFKQRLGLIVQKPSIAGGMYPHLVTWLDDERKCLKCGEYQDSENHNSLIVDDPEFAATLGDDGSHHRFVPSKNEITFLYERMKGLVEVKFKKDCLDLPEKQYRVIECKPTQSVLNAAKLITAGASTTIAGLTLLRELSDGFQYQDQDVGDNVCSKCGGGGRVVRKMPKAQSDVDCEICGLAQQEEVHSNQDHEEYHSFKSPAIPETDVVCKVCGEYEGHINHQNDSSDADQHQYVPTTLYEWTSTSDVIQSPPWIEHPDQYEDREINCPQCGGEGTTTKYKREAMMVPCPKEDVLLDILDAHDDDGRLVVYGGFTGTVDRICRVVERAGWQWIRVDGRGWSSSLSLTKTSTDELLELFQDKSRLIPRLAFIGQPSAAGMGLTLTESCEIVYYSNDFNAESRIQSEDRIHRKGMDVNRGALITDITHLPTDLLVLENLRKKRKLQDMSLGVFADTLKNMDATAERKL